MSEEYLAILPVNSIFPDPDQPRKYFDEDKLRELGESIIENGQLQPIEVTTVDDDQYILNHGERRWRASRMVGLTTIKAIVAPGKDDEERLVSAIIENVHREDLGPVDEARAYQRLLDKGWTKQALQRRMKHSGPYIEARLNWLDLEPEIQELVNAGKFPVDPRCSAAFLKVEDSELRVRLAQQIVANGKMTIRAIETICAKTQKKWKKAQLAGQGVSDKQMPSLHQSAVAAMPPPPKGEAPMLHLAANGSTPAEVDVQWNQVREAAALMCDACFQKPRTNLTEPAWMLLRQAAEVTCGQCPAWVPGDDMRVCQQCPGVIMLRQVVKQVKGA